MVGLVCWLIYNECISKKILPNLLNKIESHMDMKNSGCSYIINEDSQLLGDWGYSLTDDPEVSSVGHEPVSLSGGTETFTDGTHTTAQQIHKKLNVRADKQKTECESNESAVMNWFICVGFSLIIDSYREELGKVKLGEEKVFSLLQNVCRQVTQLSLEIIHGGFSTIHRQKLFQHTCITHQVL